MKKILEAELISIAHRVLRLKNKAQTIQLQAETQKLYEQLTLLRFLEENEQRLKGEIKEEAYVVAVEKHTTQLEKAALVDTNKEPLAVAELDENDLEVEVEQTDQKPTETSATEAATEEQEEAHLQEEIKTADNDNQNNIEEEQADEIAEAQQKTSAETVEQTPQPEVQYEDMFTTDFKEPDFVKIEDEAPEQLAATGLLFDAVEEIQAPKEEQVQETEAAPKAQSINDKFNKGINIGLNDRIAFEKRLFNGSSDDFNRVLSQLNTLDDYQEVQSFINDFVKPDYNNWDGLEEYETRFLEIVEKKFN